MVSIAESVKSRAVTAESELKGSIRRSTATLMSSGDIWCLLGAAAQTVGACVGCPVGGEGGGPVGGPVGGVVGNPVGDPDGITNTSNTTHLLQR